MDDKEIIDALNSEIIFLLLIKWLCISTEEDWYTPEERKDMSRALYAIYELRNRNKHNEVSFDGQAGTLHL